MSNMNINEKVAFLKGLMEGMKFSTETNEGNIISRVVDLIGDITEELESLRKQVETHTDYLDELDHDLGELEEYAYEDDDDYDCDCDDCDIDCDDCECDCCDCDDCDDDDDYDDDDEDEEDDLYEVECPHCHNNIYIDESLLDQKIVCPNCSKVIVDEECGDDCECGCCGEDK